MPVLTPTDFRPFKAFTVTDQPDENLSLIAIDIGYSSRNRSCGLSWTGCKCSEELKYGATIDRVSRILAEPAFHKSLLILEAPLSKYHDPDTGNPDVRGIFENGHGWYYGAGVLTLVAAMRFLEMLAATFNRDREIFLAEAFLSNKDNSTGHNDDAEIIRKNFWSVEPRQLNSQCENASSFVCGGIPSVREFKH